MNRRAGGGNLKFIPNREQPGADSSKETACGLVMNTKPQAREPATGRTYLFWGRIFGTSLTIDSMSASFKSPLLKARFDLTICLV